MSRFVTFLIAFILSILGTTCYLNQVDRVKVKINSINYMDPIQAKIIDKMETKEGILSSKFYIRSEYNLNGQNAIESVEVDEKFFNSVAVGEFHPLYQDEFQLKSKSLLVDKLRSESSWDKWVGAGGYLTFIIGFMLFFAGIDMGRK